MAKAKKNNRQKKVRSESIHGGYRIGAMVLCAITIISLVASYIL